MRYFVRYLESRKILFRLDPAAGWSRRDPAGWSSVPIAQESFVLDPFVEEISPDQARALEAELG